MPRSLVSLVPAVIVLATVCLLVASCCPFNPFRKSVTIPTASGPVQVSQGPGGSTTVVTPEGTTTVSKSGSGTKVESTDRKGDTTVVGKSDAGTTAAGGGAVVPDDVKSRLGVPIYAGAEGKVYASTGDVVTATFETADSPEKVIAWYSTQLTDGWQKVEAGSGKDTKAVFQDKGGGSTVTVSRAGSESKTTIAMLRQSGKSTSQ